jgi:hypothetical protein
MPGQADLKPEEHPGLGPRLASGHHTPYSELQIDFSLVAIMHLVV